MPLTHPNRPAFNRPAFNRPAFNRPASSVVDKKKHPDPLMGRGYINVRATGGAVKSLAEDWREI